MKRPVFYHDQYVFSDDLNFLNSSKEEALTKRVQGFLTTSGGIYGNVTYQTASVDKGGIFGSPADYLQNKNLKPFAVDPDLIFLYGGKALDRNGELIEVPDAGKTLQAGSSDENFSWVLSPNSLNYVKIKYTEESGSLQTDDLGNPHYTRFTPSYFVTVDNTPPVSPEILLGTFIADGSGLIVPVSVTDRRLYVRPIVPASGVILDPTKKIVSSFVSAEDHVNAKGSGTPSPTNPHGLTGEDLGIESSSKPHRLEAHASGIIATDGAYNTALFDSFIPSSVDLGAEVIIQFTPPASNAAILVGGEVYTDPIEDISLLDTNIFTEGDSVNTNDYYYVYMDENGDVKAQKGHPGFTPSVFLLCRLTRFDGGSTVGNFFDERTFTATTQFLIRGDILELTSFNPLTHASTLVDNLNRIRYQLGRAISGNGSQWNHALPPLTAGSTSNADNYHTHTRTSNNTFTINFDAPSGDLENMSLQFFRGAAQGFASLYWNKDSDLFALYSTQNTVFANLDAGIIRSRSSKFRFNPFEYIPSDDLEATGSSEPPLGGEEEDDLQAQLVQPSLVWNTPSNYLDLFSDEGTSTFGRLRLKMINVDGQLVDRDRIILWDKVLVLPKFDERVQSVTLPSLPFTFPNPRSTPIFINVIFTSNPGNIMEGTIKLHPTGDPSFPDLIGHFRVGHGSGTLPDETYIQTLSTVLQPGYSILVESVENVAVADIYFIP